MDIYNYLKRDHKIVTTLMEQLLETNNTDDRKNLFEQIKHELLLHAKTEQDTFYKALEEKKAVHENIDEAEEEHKEIEKYLKKLEKLEFNSREWLEQFGEFKHSFTHHVHEEEDMIFKKAKKILSDKQATELASEMDHLKELPKYQKKAQL